MATQGMFNLLGATPEEVRAKYEQGLMGKPRGGGLGRQLGYTVGRMLGGRVPGEAEAEARQQAMQQALESGETGSSMYTNLARQYQAAGDYNRAFAAMQEAKRLKTEEDAAAVAKKKVEDEGAAKTASEQARLIALRKKFPIKDGKGEYTDEQLQALAKDQTTADRLLGKEVTGTSEFERIIANLPPEQQQELLKKRAEALASGGAGSSNDDLKRMMMQLQTQQLKAELEREADDRKQKKIERKIEIQRDYDSLSESRASINEILQKAQRLVDYAKKNPVKNVFDGNLELVASKFVGTDAEVAKALTTTLQSANVIKTLLEMKQQSRTGATGFGALSNQELKFVVNSKENLNPASKDFGRQLKDFIVRYKRILARIDKGIKRQEIIMRDSGLEPVGVVEAPLASEEETTPTSTPTNPDRQRQLQAIPSTPAGG